MEWNWWFDELSALDVMHLGNGIESQLNGLDVKILSLGPYMQSQDNGKETNQRTLQPFVKFNDELSGAK